MGMYVGLDLGTHCGFAVMTSSRNSGTCFMSGTWNCSIKIGHDSPALRFVKFEQHLRDVLMMGGTKRVFYELVRAHKGPQAGHMYGAFLASMQKVCDEFDVPYQGLEVGQVKKFATGKGNAGKDAMIAAAVKLGFRPADDNEADAIHIVRCGWEGGS